MKKLAAIFLCFVFVFPLSAGCARDQGSDTPADTTTSDLLDTSASDETSAETELVEDDFGDDIDFGVESAGILYWSDAECRIRGQRD